MDKSPLTGQTFGRLFVVTQMPASHQKGNKRQWICICECGQPAIARTDHLRGGLTQSCGCLQRENTSRANTTHARSSTREYRIWSAMHSRCTNKKQVSYASHGARGIRVCEQWGNGGAGFDQFLADMGEAPSRAHSIDRIDNDGHYEPSNCRWATAAQQANNTRMTMDITVNGRTQSLTAWAQELGVAKHTLYMRLRRGWSIERAFAV